MMMIFLSASLLILMPLHSQKIVQLSELSVNGADDSIDKQITWFRFKPLSRNGKLSLQMVRLEASRMQLIPLGKCLHAGSFTKGWLHIIAEKILEFRSISMNINPTKL